MVIAASIAADSQTALQFVAVTPCRVADTRNPVGPFGGPAIAAETHRDFAIPQSGCNIPSGAAAYSLNVTVVPQVTLGYLTVWPTGENQPYVSTLNSYDGQVKANAAIVPAGNQGAVSVYVTNTADVVLDIDGYFAPVGNSTLAFYPLTPCRVVDTRGPAGDLGAPYLTGGVPRDFPLLEAASCNIPDSAQAYSLNFTAVPHGPLGFLSVWPTGQSQPYVSTLNSYSGLAVANAAIVPAGKNGSVSTYVSDNADVVIDIDGYFAAPREGGLSLYPMSPCRVLDTRNVGKGQPFTGALMTDVLDSPCVPSSRSQAYVFNATAIPSGTLGYLTLSPVGEGQPYVSTLNSWDGAVTSNMAIVPAGSQGEIDAYASNPTQLVLDISSYFAPIATLSITTGSLPSGTLGYNYSTTLGATGGVTPYTWSIILGSWPPGLNLDPNSGVISGIPTAAGNYPLTLQVADSQWPPAKATAALNLIVNAVITPLSIVTVSLPPGNQNATYSTMLAATGGITPYTWSITAGSLPIGLSLNPSTGAITGTPTGAGTANFTVKVTDSQLLPANTSAQLSLTIQPAVALSITTASLPTGTTHSPYNATLAAIGGVTPYTWTITAGSLPGGLQLDAGSGAISGMPAVGTANFTVQVADSESPPAKAAAQLSITINAGGDGDPMALNGHYAFLLNGFNSAGQWTLAGSFISDGKGNITSGVVDGNSVTGQPFNVNVSGTYAIWSSGLNTLTIQGQSFGPATFAFVLSSSGNGRIIRYDDTTGQGSRGSGVLRKQDSSAFSLAKLNGGFVFGMTGADSFGVRMANVGQFSLASGSINNGTCDMIDGGTYQTCAFYGSVSPVDVTTGRAVSTTQSDNGTSHQALYVVSASELVMEQIDSVPDGQTPLLLGSVLKQSGPFNNGSLNGYAVMYFQDIHTSDGLDQSGAGISSFDGNGNSQTIAMDEDLAGTITQDQPKQGTYSVQSNGAVLSGDGGIAGFLVSQNKGMLVGTGPNSVLGIMEPQTGGPFSNASFQGTYMGGSLAPLDYANPDNELDVISADGNGTATGGGDSSGPWGLDQWFDTVVSYSIAANGRGTAQAQGDKSPAIIYVISPTKSVILMANQDARVAVFEH